MREKQEEKQEGKSEYKSEEKQEQVRDIRRACRKEFLLSEHESFESEGGSGKAVHLPSYRIKRKLKQLRQERKYLTDDEMDSSIDLNRSCLFSDSSLSNDPFPNHPPAARIRRKRSRPEGNQEEEQAPPIRKTPQIPDYGYQEGESRRGLASIAAFNSDLQKDESQH